MNATHIACCGAMSNSSFKKIQLKLKLQPVSHIIRNTGKILAMSYNLGSTELEGSIPKAKIIFGHTNMSAKAQVESGLLIALYWMLILSIYEISSFQCNNQHQALSAAEPKHLNKYTEHLHEG